MQSVEDDPNQLTQDDTVLRQSASGHYQVIHAGALANALGWTDGDILLAVDGHEITGIGDYVEAYAALANRSTHQLKLTRAGESLLIDYRIE
ncbi:MAG: hypothetical protein KC457_15010 [Myxococcales bacterium]|nr:hypothetical protein [Myxococcales bacterium]